MALDLESKTSKVKSINAKWLSFIPAMMVTALLYILFSMNTQKIQQDSAAVHIQTEARALVSEINQKIPLQIESGFKEFPIAWEDFFRKYSDLDLIDELEECKSLEDAVTVLTCHLSHDFRHVQLTSWLDRCEADIKESTWGGKQFHELSKGDRMAALASYLVRDRKFKYSDELTTDMYNIAKVIEKNEGYCATLPVIFTLVAHRLEQPVHLVSAIQHIFCRFDDGDTKINIESTSPHAMGVGTPDSFYTDTPEVFNNDNMIKLDKDIVENTSTMNSLNLKQSISILLLNSSAAESDQERLKSIGSRKIGTTKDEMRQDLKYIATAIYFDPKCVLPVLNLIKYIQAFPKEFNPEFVYGLRAHAIRRGILLPREEDIQALTKEVNNVKKVYEDFKTQLLIFNATNKRFQLKKKPPNDHLFNLVDKLKIDGKINSTKLDQFIKENSLLLTEELENELTTIKNSYINVAKNIERAL